MPYFLQLLLRSSPLIRIAGVFLTISAFATSSLAAPTAPELKSPANNDHFEVNKPLLFWKAVPDAESYTVLIDGAKAGNVPASAGPVLNFAARAPLSVGAHQWSVEANGGASGSAVSMPFVFTIDPAGNWPAWAIGPFVRYGGNPLLRPQGSGWEQVNTYNPGVLFDHGKFRMLYRAQGQAKGAVQVKSDNISREGYAESIDGVSFVRNPEPLIDATEPFERKHGCEDARFFKKDGVYYAFYTGNNTKGEIALCEATSPDGTIWTKLGPVVDRVKNGAMVCDPNGTPVQIDGKYAMFVSGNKGVEVCSSDDLVNWSPVTPVAMNLPPNWVQPYEPCIAIANSSTARSDDVVLFLAGTLNGKGKWFYAISEVLFSKKNLTKKVEQLDDCIMQPREPYESGEFKNCLWMNCIITRNHQWMMYYGAGDRNVGLATAPMK